MWQPWVYANTAARLCLQYVHHFELFQAWQFKWIDHNDSHKPVMFCSHGRRRTGAWRGHFAVCGGHNSIIGRATIDLEPNVWTAEEIFILIPKRRRLFLFARLTSDHIFVYLSP